MQLSLRRSVVRALVLSCALTPVALAATEPKPTAASTAAKPATPAAPVKPNAAEVRRLAAKAMSAAIANLTKEYQAYLADAGKTVKLRDKPNYFLENKTSDLSDENILQALNATISTDAVADAYIKWQLGSGLSEKLDSKLLEPLFKAYVGAPAPLHRPGMTAEEKKELDTLTSGAKGVGADVINAVNDKLKVPVDAWRVKIAPILAYRDLLHSKLPPNTVFEYAALLEDLVKRVEAGIPQEETMDKWRNGVKAWLKGAPAPAEAQYLADAVLKVINDMGGIPKKPAASAGGIGTDLASAGSSRQPLDSTRAPVLLAANMRNYGTNNAANGNYPNGNYPGAAKPAMKEFPPKFYEQVEFDTKTNALKWANVAPRFIKKEILIELYQDLRDAGKAAAPAAGGTNMMQTK